MVAQAPTADQVLWMTIRNRTNAVGFRDYRAFVDGVPSAPSSGPDAYELLKQATDAFLLPGARLDPSLMQEWLGSAKDDELHSFRAEETRRLGYTPTPDVIEQMRLAYYERLGDEDVLVLPSVNLLRDGLASAALRSRLVPPVGVELLWAYWHEEGMLVDTLDAILDRFESRRPGDRGDPLARFDLDHLRPLGDVLRAWSEDAGRRLTVRRRAYEYEHEYGLRLHGRAIGGPVMGAFHVLLHLAHVFLKEDADTTVVADGFPVLNALREVHVALAEGAHNQFGDLPTTARAEMLVMQSILARPEIGDYLGERPLVPYDEPWMGAVDSVNRLYDRTVMSSTIARDLAVCGEQVVLSARFGNWSRVDDPQQAANWARYWRPEIQRYVHAYRSATGIDLTRPGALRAGRRR